MNKDISMRWLIRRDMPRVLDIEQSNFGTIWTEEDFIRCLRQRDCIGMVAEYDVNIAGFVIYELHKNRLHVLNLCIDPGWRRQGVGRVIVRKLVSKLSAIRRNRITIDVRESNLPAQLFFRSMQFRAEKILPEHYSDSFESAYCMVRRYSEVLSGADT